MKVLITGGAGFIGHHLINHFKKTFEESLAKTIEWTLANPQWIGD